MDTCNICGREIIPNVRLGCPGDHTLGEALDVLYEALKANAELKSQLDTAEKTMHASDRNAKLAWEKTAELEKRVKVLVEENADLQGRIITAEDNSHDLHKTTSQINEQHMKELQTRLTDSQEAFVAVTRQRDLAESHLKTCQDALRVFFKVLDAVEPTDPPFCDDWDKAVTALRQAFSPADVGESEDSRQGTSLWPHLAEARRQTRAAESRLEAAMELLGEIHNLTPETKREIAQMYLGFVPLCRAIDTFLSGNAPSPSRQEMLEAIREVQKNSQGDPHEEIRSMVLVDPDSWDKLLDLADIDTALKEASDGTKKEGA